MYASSGRAVPHSHVAVDMYDTYRAKGVALNLSLALVSTSITMRLCGYGFHSFLQHAESAFIVTTVHFLDTQVLRISATSTARSMAILVNIG